MFDLKIITEKYPQCIATRDQLSSLLRDLYPIEKRAVNLALMVYDSGIVSIIAKLKSIDTVQKYCLVKQLVDEYGIQEQFATEGIEAWAKAYDFYVAQDNSLVAPQNDTDYALDAYAKLGTVSGAKSDYELEEREQGVVISKFRGFEVEDVVVPNTIDDKRIIGIGEEAYKDCKKMKTLVISEGIEFIEKGAFANCENLTKAVLPYTINSIGSSKRLRSSFYGTFQGCRKLASVNMPSGLTVIESQAFFGCSSLTKIILPVHLSKIGHYAFCHCSNLNYIQFPLSLKQIGQSAFESCSSLPAVILNEGLTKIGRSAFHNCTNLSKILIPSTVSVIERAYDELDLFAIMKWNNIFKKNSENKNPKLTIYCYAGSYGLEYAREKGYPIQNAANLTN